MIKVLPVKFGMKHYDKIIQFKFNQVLNKYWSTVREQLLSISDIFPNYATESPPISDLMSFYKESKKRFDEDETFKKRAYSCVVQLQAHKPEYIKAWNLICDVSRKEFQKVGFNLSLCRNQTKREKWMVKISQNISLTYVGISQVYDRLGVVLIERGESFYQDLMNEVVEYLNSKGYLIEDEGRKVMFAKDIQVP